MGSTRSVLTYTNPNYSCANGGGAGGGSQSARMATTTAGGSSGGGSGGGKSTIWKRLKYDKAQVRGFTDRTDVEMSQDMRVFGINEKF